MEPAVDDEVFRSVGSCVYESLDAEGFVVVRQVDVAFAAEDSCMASKKCQ